MVMVTVQMGEYVETMDRQAAIVVFPEVIASVIAIAIESWRETAATEWK